MIISYFSEAAKFTVGVLRQAMRIMRCFGFFGPYDKKDSVVFCFYDKQLYFMYNN